MSNTRYKTKKNKATSILVIFVFLIMSLIAIYLGKKYGAFVPLKGVLLENEVQIAENFEESEVSEKLTSPEHPLSIASLEKTILQSDKFLIDSVNFDSGRFTSYLGHYTSQNLRINALINLPKNTSSNQKIPVIIFLHGYIPPDQYRTQEKYVVYTNYFSNHEYAVIKIDLRGHGSSQGEASGAYGSNDYVIDVRNALASIVESPNIKDISGKDYLLDIHNIGVWGHSMGGYLALRTLVVDKTVKAAVIWGGVVASHEQMINSWRSRTPFPTSVEPRRRWRTILQETYGTPEQNKAFWDSLSANSYLERIETPIQLHHAVDDEVVPVKFSTDLHESLSQKGKSSELYLYENDDHNIAKNFSLAMQRSGEFFDKYLKK